MIKSLSTTAIDELIILNREFIMPLPTLTTLTAISSCLKYFDDFLFQIFRFYLSQFCNLVFHCQTSVLNWSDKDFSTSKRVHNKFLSETCFQFETLATRKFLGFSLITMANRNHLSKLKKNLSAQQHTEDLNALKKGRRNLHSFTCQQESNFLHVYTITISG